MTKWNIAALLFLILLTAACEDDDEIFQAPPVSESAPPVPPSEPTDQSDEVSPLFDMKSEVFQSGRYENIPFRILVPKDYDAEKVYPMLMFLHGMGERGTDNERQLSNSGSFFLDDSVRTRYPAFIIYPQCPEDKYWFAEDLTTQLRGLIRYIQQHTPIDTTKIKLAGYSMGGYGTFEMVSRYPDLFEAAVAIAGAADTRKAEQMATSRWRIFAGSGDDIVPVADTQRIAKALSDAGAHVSFTLFPKAKHWEILPRAFKEPDFFEWLFSERNTTPDR